MFLTPGALPAEPIWRAFLEAAGRLQLKASVAEVKAPNLEELVHGPLKPAIPRLDNSRWGKGGLNGDLLNL